MTRKKNGFLTFIFSLLPGAGEMYMGFFKQGISLMGFFFFLIAISSWLDLGPILFVLPIVWFYSFFHVHNLASLPDQEFYAVEDKYLFDTTSVNEVISKKAGKNILAVALIAIGVCAIWNMLREVLYNIFSQFDLWGYGFSEVIFQVLRGLPQVVVSVCIIILGIYLIKGKKKKLNQEQEENNENA